MREGIKVHGSMEMIVRRSGAVVHRRKADNIILAVGFDFLCDCIGATGRPDKMSHIAIGTGVTSATGADIALSNELGREEVTYAHVAGSTSLTLTAVFPAGGLIGAVSEAGIVNAAADGVFLDRLVFAPYSKGIDDEMTVIFTIEFV